LKGQNIGAVSSLKRSYHDIVLYNPFADAVELKLYLVPTAFLDKKNIETQLNKEMEK